MPTTDPFLFCVYHKDHYPAASSADSMEAPRCGNGSDFDPDAPYRMYHGTTIPGFPQHPHRGFETVTATTVGIIDHADSVGNAGRYGHGDLQWMTAGRGVVHSEMFPLVKDDQDNPLCLFQIWLNLPSKSKMAEPGFAMFWADSVPKYTTNDGASVTLWAGEGYFGVETNNKPPPDSWAADSSHDVAIFFVELQPNARLTLPAAKESDVNRSLYFVEGDSIKIDGQDVESRTILTVKPDEIELENTSEEVAQVLLLQGKPINEPVAQYGPFVMNTQSEIQQAFVDYRQTEFGGWPWPRDDMVFEKSKGRFAKLNGVETSPEG